MGCERDLWRLREISRRSVLAGLALGVGGPALAAGIRREERVPVGDASLYLLLRGRDIRAPVLLWLHGGPGAAERPLFRLYNGELEKRFVVAYLDQRGAGRSFDADADPRRLTVAQHLADLDLVVERLRRLTGRERIVLVGHSWGSALGLLYARRHPAKVAALLATGVVTSTAAGQSAQYDFVREQAQRRGDDEALGKLREIGPPPFTARRELAIQDLVDRYGGYFHRRPSFAWATVRAMAAGITSPTDIARIIRGNNVSLEAMNDELSRLDLTTTVRRLETPVGFLLGRHDRQTDARLAAAYFQTLQAPDKALVWFENSAHNPPFEEPEAFNAAVAELVARLAA